MFADECLLMSAVASLYLPMLLFPTVVPSDVGVEALLSFFMSNIRCIIHVCERRLKGMASFYIIFLNWSLQETSSQSYYLLIMRCDYLQVHSVKAWKMISQSQIFKEQIFDFLHCALYLHWARISFATLQLNKVTSWKCLKLTFVKVKFQKVFHISRRAKS